MKDSGRQKDRQRWERKEWASLVEKHPRRVKASPWGLAGCEEAGVENTGKELDRTVGLSFITCYSRHLFVIELACPSAFQPITYLSHGKSATTLMCNHCYRPTKHVQG